MYPDVFIHETAVVDAGSEIGAGTKVWHFSHLMPRCRIGQNCILGQNVFIDNDVVIGNGVKIQNNVSVYNGVVVKDDVFIGPSVVFTNVINPRSFIERKHEFKKTIIRTGATIGVNATILCGIEVGQYALIGAGAVVSKSVIPYALVYGNPARQHGWISREGYSLFFNESGIALCAAEGKTYQIQNGRVVLNP